jgi:hypothetical protein
MPKNILNNKFLYLSLLAFVFGLLILSIPQVSQAQALICETNTIKNGEFCNGSFGKSWCGDNTLTCQVEPVITPGVNGAIGSGLSCDSCTAVCPGTEVACIGTTTSSPSDPSSTCQADLTGPNGGANYDDGDGELDDGKSGACGEIVCRTDYITCSGDCRAPATGSCTGGATLNLCTGECEGGLPDYILASPAVPQTAFIDITGNNAVGGDVLMTDGKAISVNNAGETTLYLGNWGVGGTGFNLNVGGNVYTNTHFLSDAYFGTTGDSVVDPIGSGTGDAQNIWLGDANDDLQVQGQICFGVDNSDCVSDWSGVGGGSSLWNNDGPGSAAGEIYYNGGSIGVGINDPNDSSSLHVYRDTGNNAEIDIQSVAGANQHWGIYQNRNTTDLVFWHDLIDRVAISDNNNPQVTLSNLWNIGTDLGDSNKLKISSNASALLEVDTVMTIDRITGGVGVETYILSNALYGKQYVSGASAGGVAEDVWLGDENDDIQVQGEICFGIDDSDCVSTFSDVFWEAIGNDIKNTNTGNVGIGTIAPSSVVQLDVNGAIRLGSAIGQTSGVISYSDSDFWGYNGTDWKSLTSDLWKSDGPGSATGEVYYDGGVDGQDGNVGIGTNDPEALLHISQTGYGNNAELKIESSTGNGWGIYQDRDTEDLRLSSSGAGTVVVGSDLPAQTHPIGGSQWNFWSEGDVGVSGSVYLFDGGDYYVSGADLAEEFKTDIDLSEGTVVVMGDDSYQSIKASKTAYDKTVIGVVSDNAGIVMGHVDENVREEVAMVGVVGVKVSTENGSISKGDLLVTSNTIGYAMRSDNPEVGTVVGKALEGFGGTTGNIKALINLQ